MKLSFILIEPAVPQNIGACARALKVTGFTDLRVVKPQCDILDERAKWMAHGAADVLSAIKQFDRIEDAVNDIDFKIGTTARRRTTRFEYCSSKDIFRVISGKSGCIGSAGVLFGPEERGLRNLELNLCDMVTSIPMASPYPSLNLSQAVMIYAYELSGLCLPMNPAASDRGQYTALKKRISSLLERSGIKYSNLVHQRILERIAYADTDDIHLFHSTCHQIERLLEKTDSQSAGSKMDA